MVLPFVTLVQLVNYLGIFEVFRFKMYSCKFSKTLLIWMLLFWGGGAWVQGFMCSQTGFERGWHWTLDLILPSPDAKCLDYRLVPPHHICAELGSSLASISWTPGQHTTHSNCTSRLAVIALWFPLLRDVKSVAVLVAFLCLWCGGGCVVVVQSKRIQSFICLFSRG